MLRKVLAPLALAAFFTGAADAQYQMISPMLYNGPQISLQDLASRSKPSAPPDRAAPSNTARNRDEALNPSALRYQPDLKRRRANLAMFVANARKSDPAGADKLAEMFGAGDIIEKIGGLVKPAGLRVDNVADAYALYWINAWQATRGNNDTQWRKVSRGQRASSACAGPYVRF